MGKSNKKAKSDRINALRKQYDAFLEEDKKRKARNEYILGRLDKMRISTALVPLRFKLTSDAHPSAINYVGYQSEAPSVSTFNRFSINQSKLFQDMQITNNEDTGLIQEISKKYILIPKLRSPFTNNYIQNVNNNENENIKTMQGIHGLQKTVPIKDSKPDINENTDWKSKYEILNILKNEEKQVANTQTDDVDVSEPNLYRKCLLKNNHEQVVISNDNVKLGKHGENSKKYLNEMPEKDFSEDTLHCGLKIQDEDNPKDVVFANLILDTNITDNENNESLTENDGQTDITNSKLQDVKLEYKHSNAHNTGIFEDVLSTYETQPKYNANILSMDANSLSKQNIDTGTEKDFVENKCPDEVNFSMHNDNVSIEQVVYREDDESSLTNVLHSDEMKKQLNHNSSLDIDSHITGYEFSTEAVLAQDFQANKGAQIKADLKVNPEEQTDLPINPTQQIEPKIDQVESVIEQIENPVDNLSESIDDFNAEQRDMFYSEQTDEHYPQDDAFNLDYSQNAYQQNEGYTYYDGTQSESYPIDLNDQEEAQRYDPNYAQQYSDSDEGLVKQQIEQQPQQYRQPEDNQPQPDLGMLHFEQPFENEKQIEEVLDIEDGYKAQQHVTDAVEQQYVMKDVEIDKHDIEEIKASEEIMG